MFVCLSKGGGLGAFKTKKSILRSSRCLVVGNLSLEQLADSGSLLDTLRSSLIKLKHLIHLKFHILWCLIAFR